MNILRLIIFFVYMTLFLVNVDAQSVNKKILRVTLQESKITLDPGAIRDSQSLFVSRQINCELIRSKGSTYIFEAAESIKYINPLTIRITINQNKKFHDGSSITAEDILASFDYIKQSQNVFNNFFTWIKNIHILNSKTIEFHLKKETPQFLKVLSLSNYTLFKKQFLDKVKNTKNKKLWEKPLGCGGYKVIDSKCKTYNIKTSKPRSSNRF